MQNFVSKILSTAINSFKENGLSDSEISDNFRWAKEKLKTFSFDDEEAVDTVISALDCEVKKLDTNSTTLLLSGAEKKILVKAIDKMLDGSIVFKHKTFSQNEIDELRKTLTNIKSKLS